MKKFMMALLLATTLNQASAQSITMRDVFRQMPDSLMPYLSKNNRLDFIDFLDSGMKAEVKNQLGGTSQMIALGDDSLTIRMNPSLRTDMLLMDSTVVMIETYTTLPPPGSPSQHPNLPKHKAKELSVSKCKIS